MRSMLGLIVTAMVWVTSTPTSAQVTEIPFSGDVPAAGDFFVLSFEVPEGIAEIEVQHDDQSAENILDWGLISPDGFRGYGGGNTEPAIVGEQAASRSYLAGPITPGTWHVYVGKAKIVQEPATYDVRVILREPTAVTLTPPPERQPYAPATLSTEARWYAGDFHVHSRQSGDASPTLEEVATFAESRGLDFVMLSEHNTTSQLDFYADVQAGHPELLLVPGVEVTTYSGHANAIGATAWVDHRIGFGGVDASSIVDAVHAQGALFSINHPVLSIGDLCIGCAWTAEVPASGIDAIEIQTGGYDVTGALFFDPAVTFWEDLILEGRHVTAVGGSDDHRAGTGTGSFDSPIGSPTTMVYAEELSPSAIMEGVARGRTVVKLQDPTDPLVEIWPVQPLEGDTVVADEVTFRVRVTGGDGTALRLVDNGLRGEPVAVVGDPFELEHTIQAPPTGESFHRAEVWMLGQPRVVTNHVFVTPSTTPGDGGTSEGTTGGGGCAVRRPGPGAGAVPGGALFLLGVTFSLNRRRRRPVRRRG